MEWRELTDADPLEKKEYVSYDTMVLATGLKRSWLVAPDVKCKLHFCNLFRRK